MFIIHKIQTERFVIIYEISKAGDEGFFFYPRV